MNRIIVCVAECDAAPSGPARASLRGLHLTSSNPFGQSIHTLHTKHVFAGKHDYWFFLFPFGLCQSETSSLAAPSLSPPHFKVQSSKLFLFTLCFLLLLLYYLFYNNTLKHPLNYILIGKYFITSHYYCCYHIFIYFIEILFASDGPLCTICLLVCTMRSTKN